MKRNIILLLIPFAILVSLAFAPRHADREKATAKKKMAVVQVTPGVSL